MGPDPGPEVVVAPYGAWRSPIRIEDVVGDVIALAEPSIDGDDIFWVESRPAEDGRRTLVRAAADGSSAELTPAPFNVRSRVHEYGGGSYIVVGGIVVFSNFADGRLYRLDPGAEAAVAITPAGPWRYADLRPDLTRRRFYAVREDHSGEGEATNTIVTIPLDGGDPQVLVKGSDFISSPRLSPDGMRLAWLEWDHPDMPWDATLLRVAAFEPDGTLGEAFLAAGGPDESIIQPEWAPDGTLHLISDRTGWWNLYRLVDGPRLEPLAAMEADFADPPWTFDRSSYGFLPDGAVAAVARSAGRDHLYRLVDGPRLEPLAAMEADFADPPWTFDRSSYGFLADGAVAAVARFGGRDHLYRIEPGARVTELDVPFTELEWLRVGVHAVVAWAGRAADPAVVARFDPVSLAPAGVLRRSTTVTFDPAVIAEPESIEFPTTGDRTAHALYYPPTNPGFRGPDGEKPPLIVRSHGGPTSNASTSLDLDKQFMTSRGIAFVDVDYGGSTGYGREYRQRLDGQWGVVDVDDCVAAARYLVERGDVDPDRLAIQGSSAGGYTTLAALAFRDVFAAGISLYGIGDLELLETDSHKFESKYDWRLVGPYPEAAELYRERSPSNFPDRFSSPVLILQGLDDRVVPPSQAESIVAALAQKSIPHAYLAFEGEGHGFRGAFALQRTLEARISFLGQVFGFEPADAYEPLEMPGLEGWLAGRRRPVAVGVGSATAGRSDEGAC